MDRDKKPVVDNPIVWVIGVFVALYVVWYVTGGVERGKNATLFIKKSPQEKSAETKAPTDNIRSEPYDVPVENTNQYPATQGKPPDVRY